MLRAFRFQLQFAWVNVAALLGFAAVVTVGCYLTGVPAGADNLFTTYYGAMPIMSAYILFFYSFTLCTSSLNLALSLGCRRRDYFWAVQGIVVFYAAVAWLLQLAMLVLPAADSWADQDRWSFLMGFSGGRLWVFPLVSLAAEAMGCLSGLVMARSRVAGGFAIFAAILVLMAGTVLLVVLSDYGGTWDFLLHGSHAGLWGSLPAVLLVLAAAVLIGSELYLWRTIRTYVVR